MPTGSAREWGNRVSAQGCQLKLGQLSIIGGLDVSLQNKECRVCAVRVETGRSLGGLEGYGRWGG
jgi:hypothetical protein